ncbi:hypothetical protein EB796_011501 [Bugula neritina]|uniref:Uncharacterized protein n=1 Tax=Bugula neritina TaxID=10212 RepID=A0A7J7JW47_BUGNE|nr:hypothetical protein EB796_011501 [Bugula neritina]
MPVNLQTQTTVSLFPEFQHLLLDYSIYHCPARILCISYNETQQQYNRTSADLCLHHGQYSDVDGSV